MNALGGLGYVRVDNPSEYNNLPTPIHDYANMTVFTTAMPHQLHCLVSPSLSFPLLASHSADVRSTTSSPSTLPSHPITLVASPRR